MLKHTAPTRRASALWRNLPLLALLGVLALSLADPPSGAAQTQVTVFVPNANFPVSLAFAPDGRLFYNELRTGQVRVVEGGSLQPAAFATLPTVSVIAEHGLLGLAIDPQFTVNHYVYVLNSLPAPSGNALKNQVVRFTDVNGIGQDQTLIVDNLPVGNCCHDGGRIAFGPDGKLYISVGDTQDPNAAQDPASLKGKVLRYNKDGTVPADNPTPGSPVFALGMRNQFGLAFHPSTGDLFETENGTDNNDEINIIRAGGNYGWPIVAGIANDPRFVDPIYATGPTVVAPTGITFYTGGQLPGFNLDMFWCAFNTSALTRVTLAPPDYRSIVSMEDTGHSCLLDVKTGPDGALYFSDGTTIYRWGAADTDGDGFNDFIEAFVGTNPNLACGTDNWPPDMAPPTRDRVVNITDVGEFRPVFNSVSGDGRYIQRRDLSADSRINIVDVGFLRPLFNKSCAP